MPDVDQFMYTDAADIESIMGVAIGDVAEIMGNEVSLSRGKLISQGTGARYNWFGSGSGTGYTGYGKKIQVANPDNDSNYTSTGEIHRGLTAVATAGNGSRIIATLGWSSTTSETANFAGWDQDDTNGPYVDDVIEYLDSSSGGDAQDFGDVHYYEVGFPPVGTSNVPSPSEDGSARFHFGGPAAGRDGATGYFAGGNARWAPGRGVTNEIIQRAIGSTGNSSDWGSNLSQWYADGMSGLEGYTGSPSTLDTRWVIAHGLYRTGAGSNAAGSGDVYERKMTYFTFASSSSGDEFGDQARKYTTSKGELAGFSNGDRGVFGGADNKWDVDSGQTPVDDDCGVAGDTDGDWDGIWLGNTLQYITIASTSNSCNFGDLVQIAGRHAGEVANGTHAEYCGGNKIDGRADYTGYGNTDVCQKFSIGTLGNATDHRDTVDTANGGDSGNTGQAGSN